MFGYFLLGLALLVLVLAAARLITSASPHQVLQAGKWVGLGTLGGATVFLAATGRLSWALPALAALVPWIVRLVERNRRTGARRREGSAGRTSQVETATLRMVLDHDSGSLDGEILSGNGAGQRLSALAEAELLALVARCRREDPAAVSLLEAYLDRHHEGWRDAAAGGDANGGSADADRSGGAGTAATMTREDAYRVLGLEPGASEAEIRAAYRRLIAGLHPDRGGSSFLAALINRARDVLLHH